MAWVISLSARASTLWQRCQSAPVLEWLKKRRTLRVRIFFSMLMVLLTAMIGFVIAMNSFIDVLDKELLGQTTTREIDGLARDYQALGNRAQSLAGPRGGSGQVYVVNDAASQLALPKPLSRLGPSRHHLTIELDGREHYAAWKSVDGGAIYLVVDVEPVEKLEARLIMIGVVTLLVVLLVTLVISLRCTSVILRPVKALAKRLAEVEPTRKGLAIADDYVDPDMVEIAASFDNLVERFQRFVERERAFTADAGHELRTPLSVALSTHELLLTMNDLAPKARQRALRSNAACQRMNRTVTALLFLARDEITTRVDSQPHALARELADEYTSLLETHHNTLTLDIADVTLAAPPEALNALLHNLVGHAASHSEHADIRLAVTAKAIRLDYGSLGRLPTNLDDVFQRQYQPERGGRFGLGLYLVGRLCARLGWSVWGETATDGCAAIRIDCTPNVTPSASGHEG